MSTLVVQTIESPSANEPVAIPSLDARMAKAWVVFNGTGAVAIRDSFNVAGVTDNGTGSYSVQYEEPFNDENYAPIPSSSNASTFLQVGGVADSSVEVRTSNATGAPADASYVTLSVFDN